MNRRGFMEGLVGAYVLVKTKALDWVLPKGATPTPTLSYRELADRMLPRYFDRSGSPMGLMEWAKKMEDMDYRRIALTHLPNYRYVSTVWMGLDHSLRLTGAAREIFETMAFEEQPKWSPPWKSELGSHNGFWYHEEVDCERWATEGEALIGHREMCERICPGSLTLGLGAA